MNVDLTIVSRYTNQTITIHLVIPLPGIRGARLLVRVRPRFWARIEPLTIIDRSSWAVLLGDRFSFHVNDE